MVLGTVAGVAAVIAAATVIVLSVEALRHQEGTPQPVADSPGASPPLDWDRLAGDREFSPPLASHIVPSDHETEHLRTAFADNREIADPVPGRTSLGRPPFAGPVEATADDEEDIAAALPLLEGPVAQAAGVPLQERLVPRPKVRPAIPAGPPQWLAYAVEPERAPGARPMIAIVIDDAGVAQARTARAIELPPPLTIAFIPYSRNLERQTRQARQNGHELLVHVPMEPDNGAVDPGPNALLTTLDEDEIMRRFRWALERFDGYVGVNNHMGSKFMARADLLEPLLAEMNARGLMFLDSRTDKGTVGAQLAHEMSLPHASRQVFLDNDLDAGKIAAQLERLERLALRQGHAIAIGHPHDVTVDTLARWIPQARARGFDLVPVSAIVKLAYGGEPASQLAAARRGEANGLLGSAE
ncbi:MAG: divergent polysaccharide deacetylase family protein [Rhodospirillales bacterium]|nr:MAG: divergent polysaccharide deacetylase family protein [Rhodospirillales bacterium]